MKKRNKRRKAKIKTKVNCIGQDSASRIAMRDISEYLKTLPVPITDCNDDVWIVTPTMLFNKETRRLNRELGLRNVNNYCHRMKHEKSKEMVMRKVRTLREICNVRQKDVATQLGIEQSYYACIEKEKVIPHNVDSIRIKAVSYLMPKLELLIVDKRNELRMLEIAREEFVN